MKEQVNTFRSAIFAGFMIGIAGFGFLANSVLGMFLFVVGLAAVVSYKVRLYTGTAGFVSNWKEGGELFYLILLGNIVGVILVSLMARCSAMPLQETAQHILEARMARGAGRCFMLAIGCGVLMTTSVQFARQGKDFGHWVPLLFAVPAFINCGFPHCVADAFYFATVPTAFLGAHWGEILIVYISIVLGNLVGCNLYRLILPRETKG